MDSKIKYMGTHDSLTGLYNRAFFEDELLKLQKENKPHVGIIMSDLDGLKLINDTLGHEAGDEALKCAAKIIKENVRTDDIVARIGGDEYVVLFPDISRDELKTIYERIKKSFDSYTSSHRVPWSISISFAMNEETGGNISKAITLAEDRVYLENLGKNYSSYSLVAKKILKKFTEVRDDITNHLHLDSLTVRFSRKLSLPDERVDDLRLLSEFHDIGKVGIPDELLFKPDKLKKEEKRIMKRHPEIGYRIAPPQNFDILQNLYLNIMNGGMEKDILLALKVRKYLLNPD
ncbi:MAG: diguanylate cyclase [Methanobacteriaceae archaeon]